MLDPSSKMSKKFSGKISPGDINSNVIEFDCQSISCKVRQIVKNCLVRVIYLQKSRSVGDMVFPTNFPKKCF